MNIETSQDIHPVDENTVSSNQEKKEGDTQIQSPIVTGLYDETSEESSSSSSYSSQMVGQATMHLDIIINDDAEELELQSGEYINMNRFNNMVHPLNL